MAAKMQRKGEDYDEKEKFGISLNKGYSMKIEIRLGRQTQA